MPRAGLSTERVVRAAAELADAEGLEAVTASTLARELGVRPASLYSHVASTADLRTRVALLALAEMADAAADALAGRAGPDALRAFADAYRGYAHRHPGRYAATRLPLDDATAAASAGPRNAALARAVLRGYSLGAADETHAVRLVGSVLHGFTTLELAGGFAHGAPGDPDAEASWDRAVEGLDTLLRSWGGTLRLHEAAPRSTL
jgi:AcrR family transcriptional regulator